MKPKITKLFGKLSLGGVGDIARKVAAAMGWTSTTSGELRPTPPWRPGPVTESSSVEPATKHPTPPPGLGDGHYHGEI
jgi:hypothetical protein